MRHGVLLLVSFLLSCGARTPLRAGDECPAPFAEDVSDFDLAGDEVVVAGADAIVALRKSDGRARVIAPERATHVVTNGREVAWTTLSAVERARIDGDGRRLLREADGETSFDAIAIDNAGNVAVTVSSLRPSTIVFSPGGGRGPVQVFGPPLALRDGVVFGHPMATGELRQQRVGDASFSVLLRDLVSDVNERGAIRFAPDGAVWVRSGRDDLDERYAAMLPRIDHVAEGGRVSTPYVASTSGGLGFDVDDRALILATNIARGYTGVRVEELSLSGEPRRRLAWCPELRGAPTVRADQNPRLGAPQREPPALPFPARNLVIGHPLRKATKSA